MHLIIDNKSKIEIFAALFNLLKNWSTSINMNFEKDRLYIQAMDKSHVCLANIDIKSKWFSEYETDKNIKICIDATNYAIMMNYALKHDKLEIKYIENEAEKLYINLFNKDKTDFERFFELPLIDLEEELLGIPDVEYDVEFTISSKKIVDVFGELNIFGSELNIVCNENKLEFNSSGDAGKLKVNIPVESLNEYSISEGEELDISYSLSHICKMCSSVKLSVSIDISISSDFPMGIKYNLGDDSIAAFYIAPKVKD